MENNYAIIMAGGVGSRFWPMSTPNRPKQFLDVLGIGRSLIQMTYDRLIKLVPVENVYILTNERYASIVKEQLPALRDSQILTEPQRKNTAPCIAYGAAKIYSENKDACMIVCPSDHLIMKEDRFQAVINAGIKAAQNDRIATLGIQPTRPDTGYGYIEFDASKKVNAGEVTEVVQFREKPNLETAKEFVAAGNFYWNSGIFIWKAETVLDALRSYQPQLYDLFASDLSFYHTETEKAKINYCFDVCEDISIDYAVMENAKNIDVVLADFDWSDLGTWGSLNTHLEKDADSNSIIGKNVHTFNAKNCQVNVPNDKLVLLDGLEDYIVVESDNMLMILKNENEQELKNYLKSVKDGSPDFFEE